MLGPEGANADPRNHARVDAARDGDDGTTPAQPTNRIARAPHQAVKAIGRVEGNISWGSGIAVDLGHVNISGWAMARAQTRLGPAVAFLVVVSLLA